MKNVTERISNPFDMSPPCQHECEADDDGSGANSEGSEKDSDGTETRAVFGYGDANADFHVIGDHPGVHGGQETGIPFTGSTAGERLQPVLNEVGLLGEVYSDEPTISSVFLSYLHMCCLPENRTPTDSEYDDLEPFFDAELRAISAHVLVPVGERATRYVLGTYAAREALLDAADDEVPMADLHADHLSGRGFLVVPVRDPRDWEDGDGERLVASLAGLLASDYRQTADLGRFLTEHDTYEVR